MNDQIEQLAPLRWKVRRPSDVPLVTGIQALISELSDWSGFPSSLVGLGNTGAETGSLRDARNLVITKEQFQAFLTRHATQKYLVPEDNEAMKDSYLNLDGRWFLR